MRQVAISLLLLVAVSVSSAQSRAGDSIVKQIDGLKAPAYATDKAADETYLKTYIAARKDFTKKRNDLILKLYKTDPTHPRTLELMELRWTEFEGGEVNGNEMSKRLRTDVDDILRAKPSPAIQELAHWVLARQDLDDNLSSGTVPLRPVEDFIKAFPKSERGAELLLMVISVSKDEQLQRGTDLFLQKYPSHKFSPTVKGIVRQRDAIGKPFELSFTDAITGGKVDGRSLKGKVVVVDFWATWCGPCVAKMPELIKLYDEFKGKGVEFVGVSLDASEKEGGLKRLREFVAEKKVTWPMYYLGNGWESDFSKNWGILSIPSVWIVDKQGNLAVIGARDVKAEVQKQLAKN